MSDKTSLGVIADKISFFNKLSLLSSATADNEEPTPGYMYQEISNISHESGSYCSDLLEFLVNQLSSKSCDVKYKVLKIMRYLVEHGDPQFKQGLRKNSLGITDAVQFSGPPHPFHGMALYLNVRKEAAELSQFLFNVEDDKEAVDPSQKPTVTHFTGMGSSGQGGKIQGFGNTPDKPKTLSDSLVSSVKDFAEKVLSPPQPKSFLDTAYDNRFGEYQPVSMKGSIVELDSKQSSRSLQGSREQGRTQHTDRINQEQRRPQKVKARKKGVPGGGWADSDDEEHTVNVVEAETFNTGSTQSSSVTSDKGVVGLDQQVVEVDTDVLASRLEKVHAEDFSTEENLVNDLVMDADTYVISHAELKDFTKQCSGLNCDHIFMILSNKLHEQGHVQMRCMLLLEALLRTDYVNADQIVSSCSQALVNIYNSQENGREKSKARKIIRILEKLSSSKDLLSCENQQSSVIST